MSSENTPTLYSIENLSEQQLQSISMACELMARIKMGQIEDAVRYLPIKKDIDWSLFNQDLQDITQKLKSHIDSTRASNPLTQDFGPVCWDIYQVARHKLAWDRAIKEGIVKENEGRKWPDMMQVCYDDPYKTSTQELPSITRKD